MQVLSRSRLVSSICLSSCRTLYGIFPWPSAHSVNLRLFSFILIEWFSGDPSHCTCYAGHEVHSSFKNSRKEKGRGGFKTQSCHSTARLCVRLRASSLSACGKKPLGNDSASLHRCQRRHVCQLPLKVDNSQEYAPRCVHSNRAMSNPLVALWASARRSISRPNT